MSRPNFDAMWMSGTPCHMGDIGDAAIVGKNLDEYQRRV